MDSISKKITSRPGFSKAILVIREKDGLPLPCRPSTYPDNHVTSLSLLLQKSSISIVDRFHLVMKVFKLAP